MYVCVCVNRVYYDVLCVHVHDMGLVGLNSKNLVPLKVTVKTCCGGYGTRATSFSGQKRTQNRETSG